MLPDVASPVQRINILFLFELDVMDLAAFPMSGGFIACFWGSAVLLRSKTLSAVAYALENRELSKLLQIHLKVLIANGPEFTGETFSSVLMSYGIRHLCTTRNHPSINGLVERANRTFTELLRIQADGPSSCCGVVPRALVVAQSASDIF